MALIHHHLLYQAEVGGRRLADSSEETLQKFLYDLLEVIDMKCLIPAQLKFSHQKAWTGIIGIVTSHIAFHYWTVERYVQLDIYSCKAFDREKAIRFLNEFWDTKAPHSLIIDRELGKDFLIERRPGEA